MVKIYGLSSDEVTDHMRSGTLTIDVVGIGKMGLPLAALLAREGARVIGVRRNERMVDEINAGRCPIEEEPKLDEILAEVVSKGKLEATTDAEWAARESDVILILVPLLVDERGNPDFAQMESACVKASAGIEKGDLVIVETTMPPGSTRGVVLPMLESSGLRGGEDFGVVHAPERLMTGRVIRNIYRYPKIVGGIDDESTEAASGIYTPFGEVVRVSSLETAELVKVSEGVYRDVNIAYANTLAMFCESHGVDAWEVIHAANHQTQDYCHIHRPGSGVGGHCIPVYPWFLITRGTQYGTDVSLIREARRVNDSMPGHMKELIDSSIRSRGLAPESSSVGILGLAFRGGVKETRLSPTIKLLGLLGDYREVLLHDPLFTDDEIRSMGFTPSDFDTVLGCDVVALMTDHQEYRDAVERLNRIGGKLVDGRNVVPTAEYKIGNVSRRD